MAKVPRQYSREKRKEQIVNQFRVWRMNGDMSPKTFPRIARALGLVASPHISEILNEMVVEGKLTVEHRDQSGRWTTRFFLLSETSIITEKLLRRHVSVRNRGQVVGQIALPL